MTAFDRAWAVVKEKLCESKGCQNEITQAGDFCDECLRYFDIRPEDEKTNNLCEGCDIGAKEGDGYCDECLRFYSLYSAFPLSVKDMEEHL